MSTSDQTNPTRMSNSSQATSTQHSSTSSQTAVSQPSYQEISRWSPDSSSLAASASGGVPSEHQSNSRPSVAVSAAGSMLAAHRSSTSTQPSADTVAAERARAASALDHGVPPAPPEERTGETYGARMIEDPAATQHVSSSGHDARRARGLS
ncbi:hypothetical protein FQN51_004888 [Onygenales sp. PD_10]|nr:hypothetical protein FQN51_004888 [Onygenales sp. PD_10]